MKSSIFFAVAVATVAVQGLYAAQRPSSENYSSNQWSSETSDMGYMQAMPNSPSRWDAPQQGQPGYMSNQPGYMSNQPSESNWSRPQQPGTWNQSQPQQQGFGQRNTQMQRRGMSETRPNLYEQGQGSSSAADRQLTDDVRRQFKGNSALQTLTQNVNVTAQRGTIILRGSVKNTDDKQTLEAAVRDMKGVLSVDNQLTVTNTR